MGTLSLAAATGRQHRVGGSGLGLYNGTVAGVQNRSRDELLEMDSRNIRGGGGGGRGTDR